MNRLAERAMQTFKYYLRKALEGYSEDKLSMFLFQYRIIPHTTTGSSPAQLQMGRQPRSRLYLLRPNLASKDQQQQGRQKANLNNQSRHCSFTVDDAVYYVADLHCTSTRYLAPWYHYSSSGLTNI